MKRKRNEREKREEGKKKQEELKRLKVNYEGQQLEIMEFSDSQSSSEKISYLPPEIKLIILIFVISGNTNLYDLLELRKTCKEFSSLITDEADLWRPFYNKYEMIYDKKNIISGGYNLFNRPYNQLVLFRETFLITKKVNEIFKIVNDSLSVKIDGFEFRFDNEFNMCSYFSIRYYEQFVDLTKKRFPRLMEKLYQHFDKKFPNRTDENYQPTQQLFFLTLYSQDSRFVDRFSPKKLTHYFKNIFYRWISIAFTQDLPTMSFWCYLLFQSPFADNLVTAENNNEELFLIIFDEMQKKLKETSFKDEFSKYIENYIKILAAYCVYTNRIYALSICELQVSKFIEEHFAEDKDKRDYFQGLFDQSYQEVDQSFKDTEKQVASKCS